MNSIASCSSNWMNKYKKKRPKPIQRENATHIYAQIVIWKYFFLHPLQYHHRLAFRVTVHVFMCVYVFVVLIPVVLHPNISVIKDNLFVDNLLLTTCNKYVSVHCSVFRRNAWYILPHSDVVVVVVVVGDVGGSAGPCTIRLPTRRIAKHITTSVEYRFYCNALYLSVSHSLTHSFSYFVYLWFSAEKKSTHMNEQNEWLDPRLYVLLLFGFAINVISPETFNLNTWTVPKCLSMHKLLECSVFKWKYK